MFRENFKPPKVEVKESLEASDITTKLQELNENAKDALEYELNKIGASELAHKISVYAEAIDSPEVRAELATKLDELQEEKDILCRKQLAHEIALLLE